MRTARCGSVGAVPDANRTLRALQLRIRSWLTLWGAPSVGERLVVEWSPRLSRSLGRAYPGRCLIRLSPVLLTLPRADLLAAACHEVAHIAAPVVFGGRCPPHGQQWASLVRAAGFEPYVRLPLASRPGARLTATPPRASLVRYLHACEVCHSRRLARRPVHRWRCARCVNDGLEGRLRVMVVQVRTS
jgi:predicted SprT family Zn-dependent metalloprotease